MQRKAIVIMVVMAAFVSSGAPVFGALIEAEGTIESVTLYRGQALVTRLVSIEAPAGVVELRVRNLPEQIVPDSVYASARDGLQVRAVRYRTQAVEETPREDVRNLDGEIELVERAIRQQAARQKLLYEQMAYLGKMENFVAPTAQVEMSKGVLNAQTLKEMTLFIFEQRKNQSEDAFKLQEEVRELQKQLGLLRRKRSELTRGGATVERDVLIFLEKDEAGRATLRLSYLVSNATWSPAYNVRSSGEMESVDIEYNALVRQISGEDWSGVSLTLSTASPAMGADPLVLAPMLVTVKPRALNGRRAGEFKGQYAAAQRKLLAANTLTTPNPNREQQIMQNWVVNVISNRLQGYELNVKDADQVVLQELQRSESLGLSANYELPGKTSLSSRSDQQIVRIASLNLPARFSNVAMPLLTQQVYRQAEVVNSSSIALLDGQSSVYLNGEFVGKGSVPVVACGQRFLVGFGTDPQLRARREFVSRADGVRSWLRGGNREVASKYRLVFDNYKDEAIKLRVF